MRSKTKIIIGIIVIGIALTSLWMWNKQLPKDDDRKFYGMGENITFRIMDVVEICDNDLPYRIINPNTNKPYGTSITIRHSCFGFAGNGIDQYCENETIKTVSTEDRCSDALRCLNKPVNEIFTWDQTEYVEITEQCEGKTIKREVRRQVPAGTYQVIVNGKVIKEFTIGK